MSSFCHLGRIPQLLRLKLELGLSRRNRQSRRRPSRAVSAHSEPTSQIAKSSGTWPESVSSFFADSRKRGTNSVIVDTLSDEVSLSISNGGSDEPPSNKKLPITDEQPPEEDDEESHELLNLAEVRATKQESFF